MSCSYIPMTKTKLRKAATAGAAAARLAAAIRWSIPTTKTKQEKAASEL